MILIFTLKVKVSFPRGAAESDAPGPPVTRRISESPAPLTRRTLRLNSLPLLFHARLSTPPPPPPTSEPYTSRTPQSLTLSKYTNVIGRPSKYTNVIGRPSKYTNVIGRPSKCTNVIGRRRANKPRLYLSQAAIHKKRTPARTRANETT